MGGTPHSKSGFAVIGAGLAGLTTAIALSAAGADVTVFEARNRVGGRLVSAPCPAGVTPALALDLGAQWVGPGQTRMLGLIKELDLHLVTAEKPGSALWGVGGELVQGRASLPPLPPLAMAEVLANAKLAALMSKWISPESPWTSRRAARWDRISVHKWISRHLRTAPARELAAMMIRANAALEPSETSLLGILFDLRSVGPARNLITAEAFRVREGTHEIARRLAEQLTGKIRFGEPVRALVQDNSGVTVETDNGALRCRRAAVCVPPPVARKISFAPALPDARARLLAGVEMGATVKFHALYNRPFWRQRGLSGQAMSSTGAVGLTYDNSPDDGSGPGVLVGFAVGEAARDLGRLAADEQTKEILTSLSRFFGPEGAAPESIALQDWGAEEWTGGCYAGHFPVGGWTSYGHAFREPCGRIHWAGTETASEWHGYMEGAVLSGDRAAVEMLLADAQACGGGR